MFLYTVIGMNVNDLTMTQITETVERLRRAGYIKTNDRGQEYTTSVPTKANGHPQATVSGTGKKFLIHQIYYRYINNGALVSQDPMVHISHVDADQRVLSLVEESRDMNESRKYCHMFHWYRITDAFGVIMCPHRESSKCTGPNESNKRN